MHTHTVIMTAYMYVMLNEGNVCMSITVEQCTVYSVCSGSHVEITRKKHGHPYIIGLTVFSLKRHKFDDICLALRQSSLMHVHIHPYMPIATNNPSLFQ